jgi:hypothetical protein
MAQLQLDLRLKIWVHLRKKMATLNWQMPFFCFSQPTLIAKMSCGKSVISWVVLRHLATSVSEFLFEEVAFRLICSLFT